MTQVARRGVTSLLAFREDYPMARAYLLHAGTQRGHDHGVEILPIDQAFRTLETLLGAKPAAEKPRARKPRRT